MLYICVSNQVLAEALTRKFTIENIQTVYEAVKMSCRTLLKFENLTDAFENFRNILRETCIKNTADREARKLVRLLYLHKQNLEPLVPQVAQGGDTMLLH